MRKFSTGKALICAGLIAIPVALWVLVTQPLWGESAAMATGKVNPLRLNQHVRIISETFYPRDQAHTENLDRTANYIRNEFRQTEGKVVNQCYEARSKTYCNVIAQFGPDTKERIVVGGTLRRFW